MLKNPQNKVKYVMQIFLTGILIYFSVIEDSYAGFFASIALCYKCLGETYLLIDYNKDDDTNGKIY